MNAPPSGPRRALARQIRRFAGTGVIAAVGHYGSLVLAVELLRFEPVPAAVLAYTIGGAIAYLLNRNWTFESDAAHERALPRFVLANLVALALTALLMALFTGPLGLHYLPAQLLTTGTVMVWNFLAYRHWTFAPATPRG
ncbi:MAG: GtrA family protein [Geminicoccaceae bacterium]|nr:GtrA family protein [Geminicoccaceae bacterium]